MIFIIVSFSQLHPQLYSRLRTGILCIPTVEVVQCKADGHHG